MYIVTGSVTSAVRLKRILESVSGYPAEVVHTPASIKRRGCSYSVLADDRLREFIRPFCAEYDVPLKGIYMREGEDFYAVSG